MFQVGDLVIYEDVALANDIPGIVVALVSDCDYDADHLKIQWFDWEPGALANEDPKRLIIVSSISE